VKLPKRTPRPRVGSFLPPPSTDESFKESLKLLLTLSSKNLSSLFFLHKLAFVGKNPNSFYSLN